MNNKTILIVVDNGFSSRALLWSGVLDKFSKRFQRVVILVPGFKADYFKRNFEKDNVVVDAVDMTESTSRFFKTRFFTLLQFSIPSRHARIKIMQNIFGRYGFKMSVWVIYVWPALISQVLSRFKFWRAFLRQIYRLIRFDEKCLIVLEKHKPDVIYLSYGQIYKNNFNVKLLKVAKKLNIKTVGNIFSWDHLYNKTLILEHTDLLTVPNAIIAKDAVKMTDFKEKDIRIVGLPYFDFYFDKSLLINRPDFFKSIGANPNKNFIFFAGGLPNLGVDEDYLIKYFNNLTKNELVNCQFYLRPHPKYLFSNEIINRHQNNPSLIFEKRRADTSEVNFELTRSDSQLLYNLVYHSDVIVCVFSTIMIEASLMNKPVISLGYFSQKKFNYFYRPERILEYDHLAYVFKRDFCPIAKDDKELLAYIQAYLQNPSLHSQARIETAKEQAGYLDGGAGERLVKVLEKMVQ